MFLVAIEMFQFDVSNSPLSPNVLLVCSAIFFFEISEPSETGIKAMELPIRANFLINSRAWTSQGSVCQPEVRGPLVVYEVQKVGDR